jgi:hypothetical protein
MWNCVKQILIQEKLQAGKTGKKTKMTGRSPLRRGSSALHYSTIEKEEEEEEEEENEKKKE